MKRIPVHRLIPLLKVQGDDATKPGKVIVERYSTAAPTVNAYGEMQRGTPELLALDMVIHQATREQLERAGIDYGPDWRACYAREELRTATPGPADVVRYQGERWELVNSADYDEHGGMHMALGRRIE